MTVINKNRIVSIYARKTFVNGKDYYNVDLYIDDLLTLYLGFSDPQLRGNKIISKFLSKFIDNWMNLLNYQTYTRLYNKKLNVITEYEFRSNKITIDGNLLPKAYREDDNVIIAYYDNRLHPLHYSKPDNRGCKNVQMIGRKNNENSVVIDVYINEVQLISFSIESDDVDVIISDESGSRRDKLSFAYNIALNRACLSNVFNGEIGNRAFVYEGKRKVELLNNEDSEHHSDHIMISFDDHIETFAGDFTKFTDYNSLPVVFDRRSNYRLFDDGEDVVLGFDDVDSSLNLKMLVFFPKKLIRHMSTR